MAAAAEGRGVAVLLEGPAGIGKTSLLEAALRLAEGRLGVLAARGGELERDFAYGVVRQLFERRVADAPERWLDGAAALAAPLVGLETGERPGDDPTAAALHGLYWLTANLAADGPLLVAIDDLHWVDAASLRFLAYLARRVGELPVLLVAASRPPSESHAPDVLEALAAERLEPAPLSVAAVGRLVGDELAAACHEATGGNPFLVAAAAEHGELDPRNPARSVIRFVSRRLGGLGPDAVALARAVAVLGTGRRAAPRVRARRARRRRGRRGRAGRRRRAGRAPAARVRAPDRPRRGRRELSPPERARRHLAAARMLDAEGGDAERLARTCSRLTHEPTRGWWRRCATAAARSVARGAPDAAVRYLRRALDEPPAPTRRPALLAETGRAEVRAALPDDAVGHLRAAIAADSRHDPRARPRDRADRARSLHRGGADDRRLSRATSTPSYAAGSRPNCCARRARCRRRSRSPDGCLSGYLRRSPTRRADGCCSPRSRTNGSARRHGDRGARAGSVAGARRRPDRRAVRRLGPRDGRRLRARDGRRLRPSGSYWDDALADVRRRGSVIGFARTRAYARCCAYPGPTADAESEARNRDRRGMGARLPRRMRGWPTASPSRRWSPGATSTQPTRRTHVGRCSTATSPDGYMINFVLHQRRAAPRTTPRDSKVLRGAGAPAGEVGQRDGVSLPLAHATAHRGGGGAGAGVGRAGTAGPRAAGAGPAPQRSRPPRCQRHHAGRLYPGGSSTPARSWRSACRQPASRVSAARFLAPPCTRSEPAPTSALPRRHPVRAPRPPARLRPGSRDPGVSRARRVPRRRAGRAASSASAASSRRLPGHDEWPTRGEFRTVGRRELWEAISPRRTGRVGAVRAGRPRRPVSRDPLRRGPPALAARHRLPLQRSTAPPHARASTRVNRDPPAGRRRAARGAGMTAPGPSAAVSQRPVALPAPRIGVLCSVSVAFVRCAAKPGGDGVGGVAVEVLAAGHVRSVAAMRSACCATAPAASARARACAASVAV